MHCNLNTKIRCPDKIIPKHLTNLSVKYLLQSRLNLKQTGGIVNGVDKRRWILSCSCLLLFIKIVNLVSGSLQTRTRARDKSALESRRGAGREKTYTCPHFWNTVNVGFFQKLILSLPLYRFPSRISKQVILNFCNIYLFTFLGFTIFWFKVARFFHPPVIWYFVIFLFRTRRGKDFISNV